MSLRERRDILALAQGNADGVLITLVRASGSSYRQPGARLLSLPDGRTAGTISGGCLEADLLRKAQWRVRGGAAMHSYDTGFDDDAEIPFGLGCGGVVDLLLEDLHAPETLAVLEAIDAALHGKARIVVTQLPSHAQGFARIVLDLRGDVLFATDALETDRIVDLRAVARYPEAGNVSKQHLFLEYFEPAQRLVLCGAGEDAKPVTRLAAELGWTVIVADGRPQQASTGRFSAAESVHVTHTLAAVSPLPSDAVVIMTHSFQQDRDFLTELLALPVSEQPRYVGLLGARHRSALLLRHAAEVNRLSLGEAIARVHAPVGLELGGEGPESIALAIVSQVQHVLTAAPAAQPGVLPRRMSVQEAEQLLDRIGDMAATHVCALDAGPATLNPQSEVHA